MFHRLRRVFSADPPPIVLPEPGSYAHYHYLESLVEVALHDVQGALSVDDANNHLRVARNALCDAYLSLKRANDHWAHHRGCDTLRGPQSA